MWYIVASYNKVIIVKKPLGDCNHIGISFSITVGSDTLIVPDIINDITVYPDNMLHANFKPVNIILKTLYNRQLDEINTGKSEIRLYRETPYKPLFSSMKKLMPNQKLNKLGVAFVLQGRKRSHYFFNFSFSRRTWHQNRKQCENVLNATAFSYSSFSELKEIASIQNRPTAIWTAFKKNEKVKCN